MQKSSLKKVLIISTVLLLVAAMFLAIPVSAAEPNSEETDSSFWGKIGELLSSSSVVIGVIGLGAWAIFRSGSKIFKEGIYFKSELVSKKEMREFEESIRQDMRGYRVELQKVILDTCLREIKSSMKDLDSIKKDTDMMKELRIKLEHSLKDLDEKYDEIRGFGNQMQALRQKVQKLEIGKDANEVRRSAE